MGSAAVLLPCHAHGIYSTCPVFPTPGGRFSISSHERKTGNLCEFVRDLNTGFGPNYIFEIAYRLIALFRHIVVINGLEDILVLGFFLGQNFKHLNKLGLICCLGG